MNAFVTHRLTTDQLIAYVWSEHLKRSFLWSKYSKYTKYDKVVKMSDRYVVDIYLLRIIDKCSGHWYWNNKMGIIIVRVIKTDINTDDAH